MLLLFVITLGLYLTSLRTVFYSLEILTLDDNQLIDKLSNNNLTFNEVLRPGWQGKYYRPVIDLSFFIEQYLWGGQPFGYRMTNVLIHAFNSILLYLLAGSLLKFEKNSNRIAFFSAFLFAVHPIAVESVVWISGRTDPLATFWSLLGVIFYLLWKDREKRHLILLSLLFISIAVLAKEVAIATPVALVLLEIFFLPSFAYKKSRLARFAIISSLAFIPAYLLFRSFIIKGKDLGVGFILDNLTKGDIAFPAKMIAASIGFYFKKFVWPVPLNFGIDSINLALYAALGGGVITAIVILFFVEKYKKYCFLLIWALGGILPAALISFTNVAWTPWAERYLYYSTVPLSIASGMLFVGFYHKVKDTKINKPAFVICLIPLLIFIVLTLDRSIVMSSNELLWKDSYSKSPDFMGAADEYAKTLLRSGNMEEAEKVLTHALLLDAPKHLIYLKLGDISYPKGDYDKMRDYYLKALNEARNDKRLVTVGAAFRRDILSKLAAYNIDQAIKAEDDEMKIKFYEEGITNLIDAYKELPTNFINYRIAKIYISTGEKEKTAEYLERFINGGGAKGYTKPAIKLLNNIEAEIARQTFSN